MTDLQPTYDPHTEVRTYTNRRDYHTEQTLKHARNEYVARYAARRTDDAQIAADLLQLSENQGSMAEYHAREAEKAAEDLRDALARCHDLETRNAAALHAAADAADAMGDATLAIELNRRAARAEGYDPDDTGEGWPAEDRPDCDEGTPNTPARDDPDWPAEDREY